MKEALVFENEIDYGLIEQYVRQKQSFNLVNVQNFAFAVKKIEQIIESQGLKVRVYIAKRSGSLLLGLIPTGITQFTAIGSALAIAVHNLATFNPHYEIAKHLITRDIEVIYKQKDSK